MPLTSIDVNARVFKYSKNYAANSIALIKQIMRGVVQGHVVLQLDAEDATAATNTAAFTFASGADGDTVTVLGVVFTARTSPSTEPLNREFALSTDDDTTSAAFAAAINAYEPFRNLITAANSSGTTTLTSSVGGAFMNFGTLATSNASFVTVGGANFSSGDEDGTLKKNIVIAPDANNY